MKKRNLMKTIQLIVFGILGAAAVFLVIGNGSGNSRAANFLLWITLALSFFFLFLDFSSFEEEDKKYSQLIREISSDEMTNLANRYSIDRMIDKYANLPLPESFCCVVLTLSNIRDVNEKYGRQEGNEAIRRFSLILKMASVGHCFVGRNGGNKFVALFEEGSEDSVRHFLERMEEKIRENNADSSHPPLEFEYGTAFSRESGAAEVTDLISLADRRVGRQKQDKHPETGDAPAE